MGVSLKGKADFLFVAGAGELFNVMGLLDRTIAMCSRKLYKNKSA